MIQDDEYQSSDSEYDWGYSASVRVMESDKDMSALRTFRADEGSIEQVAFRQRATKEIRTEDGPKEILRIPE